MSYLKDAASTRATPQREPIPGREPEMDENLAGGYAFRVGSLDQLRRFLILGTEGGSYYASQYAMTRDNARAIFDALNEHGPAAVEEIVAVSTDGRAPKNDPAIFALAIAASHRNVEVREAALASLPRVCRTATHLFAFCELVEDFRGWGRALKRAVGAWYLDRDPGELAYQLTKYRQRNGWTHADVLRLAKPRGADAEIDALLRWAVGKFEVEGVDGERFVVRRTVDFDAPEHLSDAEKLVKARMDAGEEMRVLPDPELLTPFLLAQSSPSAAMTAKLVRTHGKRLPRETLRTDHLNDPEVWRAQLEMGMPITALLRNLATMTRNGTLDQIGGEYNAIVADALTNREQLIAGRVHPIAVLAALTTYAAGRSPRSGETWAPIHGIVSALDDAFYLAFDAVEPAGKRTLLALDVSGSMDRGSIAGIPGLTPRLASAALALVTMRTEPEYATIAFTNDSGNFYDRAVKPLAISPRQRLDDVVREVRSLPFGGTDCALPMIYARSEGIDVDTFVILTDNETWAGGVHPSQALRFYREKTGIDARLVVVGMTATSFSIADPADRGSMDVVGFDTATPAIISAFSAGRL